MSAPAGGGSGLVGTVTGLANGTAYNIVLTATTSQGSASSAPSASVIPYGPIPAPSVTMNKVGAKTMSVSVSANGNGRQINVHVWTGGTGGQRVWDFTTVGAQGWNSGNYDVDWNQTQTAYVTITDTVGRGVPGQVTSGTVQADPPPPPPTSVTVSKGNSATGQVGCSSSACTFIAVTTSGFTSNVTCSPDSQHGSQGFVTWSQGANESKVSPNYYGYPNTWVRVTCTDGQGHTNSGQITW